MPNLILKTVMDNKDLTKSIKDTEKAINDLKKTHEKNTADNIKEVLELGEEYEKLKQEKERYSGYEEWKKNKTKEYKEQGYNKNQIEQAIDWDTEAEGWIDVDNRVDEINEQMNDLKASTEIITNQIDKESLEYEEQKKALEEKIAKVQEIIREKEKEAAINKRISKTTNEIGKKMNQTVKKVRNWALALIGIRGVYGALRQAMSVVTQNNEELAKKLESIKYTLAMSLAPIIEKIINGLYRMVQYVQWIIKSLTGHDIFKGAADNLANANQSAKEMKKSLAGFDTANVLSDNNSSSSSSPTAMTGLTDAEIPTWLTDLVSNSDTIIAVIGGITAALVMLKLVGLDPITSIGIGMLVGGLIYSIQSLIKFLNDPTFENFTNIIIGIGVAIGGLALIIGSVPLAVTAAVVLIVATIVKNYDFIMGLFDKAIKWIENDFVGMLTKIFGPLGNILAAPFIYFINLIRGAFDGFFGGIKQVIDGIIKLFKGDFLGGLKDIAAGILSIMLAPLNGIIDGINSLIKGINKLSFDVPDWVPLIGGNTWGFNLPKIPKIKFYTGGIINNPGHGVPLGNSVIGGEVSREGVIPLTNEQAMSELGQEIGKWISVNIDLTTKLDGRILSKNLEKIQQKNAFVRNGG